MCAWQAGSVCVVGLGLHDHARARTDPQGAADEIAARPRGPSGRRSRASERRPLSARGPRAPGARARAARRPSLRRCRPRRPSTRVVPPSRSASRSASRGALGDAVHLGVVELREPLAGVDRCLDEAGDDCRGPRGRGRPRATSTSARSVAASNSSSAAACRRSRLKAEPAQHHVRRLEAELERCRSRRRAAPCPPACPCCRRAAGRASCPAGSPARRRPAAPCRAAARRRRGSSSGA